MHQYSEASLPYHSGRSRWIQAAMASPDFRSSVADTPLSRHKSALGNGPFHLKGPRRRLATDVDEKLYRDSFALARADMTS